MKIGIDISAIQYRGTGVSRYMQELTKSLINENSHHYFHLAYVSWGNRVQDTSLYSELKAHPSVQFHEIRLPEKVAHVLWNRLNILHIERFAGPLDAFLYGDWFLMPTWASRFTTVHDLVFKLFPETVDPYVRKTQEQRLAYIAKENIAIFVDSYATKRDLERFYPNTKGRIKVVYPGITTLSISDELLQKTLKKYGLRKNEYIITVGNNEPRKNLHRLLDAWKHTKHNNCELAVIGPSGWGGSLASGSNTRTLGLVSDNELFALYKGARGFVMTSLYEGFGFPVGEAMAMGIPVCVSNTSSLPEIAGDSGIYCEPTDISSIINGLEKLLQDSPENRKRAIQGKKDVESFNWKVAAHAVMRSLEYDNRH